MCSETRLHTNPLVKVILEGPNNVHHCALFGQKINMKLYCAIIILWDYLSTKRLTVLKQTDSKILKSINASCHILKCTQKSTIEYYFVSCWPYRRAGVRWGQFANLLQMSTIFFLTLMILSYNYHSFIFSRNKRIQQNLCR